MRRSFTGFHSDLACVSSGGPGGREATMSIVRFLGEERIAVEPQAPLRPAPGEVLVRVEASALCGSELHAYRGAAAHPSGNPGHEAAGVVIDANGSALWREGDRVGLSAVQGCGACTECQAG